MPWRRSKGPMGRGVHHHRSNGQLGLLATLGGDRRQQTRRQGRRRTRAPAREPAREQPWCLGSPERPERPLNGPPAMPAAIYPRDVTRECERGLLGMDEVPKGTVGGTHTTMASRGDGDPEVLTAAPEPSSRSSVCPARLSVVVLLRTHAEPGVGARTGPAPFSG